MSLNIKNAETCRLAAELAELTGETLLYKGEEFARTDVKAG